MYRSKVKTPLLLPSVEQQLKNSANITEKQTQILTIMAAYIKGQTILTETYDSLEKLKKSIT